MGARLAFVDDPARTVEVPEGWTVVALEPSVALAVPHAMPLDLHLDDLELETLGERTYGRVEEICDALDRLAGIAPATARWRFQELKALYDGLFVRGLAAARLAAALDAKEALLLVRGGSLAARVIPPVLLAAGVGVRVVEAPRTPGPPGPSTRLRDRLAAARVGLRRRARAGRPRILCLDERYNVPAIAAALTERDAETMLWLPPPRRPRAATPTAEGLAPLFRFGDLDLWPAAEPAIDALLAERLPADAAALCAARAAIRRDRPDALLGSAFADPRAKAAAVAAREAGAPSIVSRHGEQGLRALPVMRLNDLDVVDHALCWGRWEAAFVERHAPRPVWTSIVGAPMIEEAAASAPSRAELRRELGIRAEELVVLLVPTALSGDGWYAGRRVPFDLSYFRHQIAVVEALLSVEGLRVLVKEHTDDVGPLETWSRSTGSPVSFVRDKAFPELIHLADAVVLDFASTTLVQALHGSGHVYLVSHPITAWEPGVLDHLESHGVRVAGADRLAGVLRADLAVGRLRAPAIYPPEAWEPLAASGPGTAADRAADAVLEIVSGYSPGVSDSAATGANL